MSDTYAVLIGGSTQRVFTRARRAEEWATSLASEQAMLTAAAASDGIGRVVTAIVRDNGKSVAARRIVAIMDLNATKLTVEVGPWRKGKAPRS